PIVMSDQGPDSRLGVQRRSDSLLLPALDTAALLTTGRGSQLLDDQQLGSLEGGDPGSMAPAVVGSAADLSDRCDPVRRHRLGRMAERMGTAIFNVGGLRAGGAGPGRRLHLPVHSDAAADPGPG